MSSRLTRLLQDLRSVLLESAADSEEAGAVLAEIQQAGLSVFLVIDDSDNRQEPEALALTPQIAEEGELSPAFKIDQADLALLRGLGIDPTRTLRRRRRARRK